MHYYNEFEPDAAGLLSCLVAKGLLPHADVDTRDIRTVSGDDLLGYTQAHFFAGCGAWQHALSLAGWPADASVWTGSCPCQPYSNAGKRLGNADDRDLWPEFFRLIRERSPQWIFGEQVASAIRHGWIDRLSDDLESEGYTVGSAVLRACSVGAPHERARLYWGAHKIVGDAHVNASQPWRQVDADESARRRNVDRGREPSAMADTRGEPERKQDARHTAEPRSCARVDARRRSDGYRGTLADANGAGLALGQGQLGAIDDGSPAERNGNPVWCGDWRECADGNRRLFSRGIPLVANGPPRRLAGPIRIAGNAIVPQVAAEFIVAFREAVADAQLSA
jgi:DNA (cytosine-5)-methyltransferase 1